MWLRPRSPFSKVEWRDATATHTDSGFLPNERLTKARVKAKQQTPNPCEHSVHTLAIDIY